MKIRIQIQSLSIRTKIISLCQQVISDFGPPNPQCISIVSASIDPRPNLLM